MIYQLTIPGKARPQGSKSVTKSGRMYETVKGVGKWRAYVTRVAKHAPEAPPQRLTAPIRFTVYVTFARPKSHLKRDGGLSAAGRKYPIPPKLYGDGSKLLRAIEDSLTNAGWWGDDSDIEDTRCVKRWGERDEVTIVAEQL